MKAYSPMSMILSKASASSLNTPHPIPIGDGKKELLKAEDASYSLLICADLSIFGRRLKEPAFTNR